MKILKYVLTDQFHNILTYYFGHINTAYSAYNKNVLAAAFSQVQVSVL